ncbi:MAG TPA: rhodanese-like domain-containing protein [Anaeromyxobacteraceae bacterium]|nr:rhodanese-like domain-containing protein [Anaeromyxobacteraceae bacterium]
MVWLRALAFMTIAVPVLACAQTSGGAPARGKPLDTPPGIVDGRTAQELVKAGVVVVDVRTPQEFAGGHVPGAKNIPYDEIRARAGEIGGPDTPVLLYCKSGRRSAIAASALKDLGYKKLWDMQSYDRWPQ